MDKYNWKELLCQLPFKIRGDVIFISVLTNSVPLSFKM